MHSKGQGSGCVILQAVDTVGEGHKHSNGYYLSDAVKVEHSYPLKVIMPRYANQGTCKWIYPITFGGGLVGGDHISLDIVIGRGCCGLVTSAESLKVYECDVDTVTRLGVRYTVCDVALLCVIADPVVCFKDSCFVQDQVIKMAARSNLVFLDWTVGGRVSLGELWTFRSCTARLAVYVDDTLVLNEKTSLRDTPLQTLTKSMGIYQVTGLCVVLGDQVKHVTQHLHKLCGKLYNIGDTLPSDVICSFSPVSYTVGSNRVSGCYVRFLAVSTSKAYSLVKQMTQPLVDVLGGEPLSRSCHNT